MNQIIQNGVVSTVKEDFAKLPDTDKLGLLVTAVCSAFEIEIIQLKKGPRSQRNSYIRAIYYFTACRLGLKISLRDIGDYLERGDHSCVIHARDNVAGWLKEPEANPVFIEDYWEVWKQNAPSYLL
jgi:chromosomal replication initiation ATPase DnaA